MASVFRRFWGELLSRATPVRQMGRAEKLVGGALLATLFLLLLSPIPVALRWIILAAMGAVVIHYWARFYVPADSPTRLRWDYAVLFYDSFLVSWLYLWLYDALPTIMGVYFLVILVGAWVRKLEGGSLAATLAIIGYNTVTFFANRQIELANSVFISFLFGLAGLGAGLLSQQEEMAKEALETERERARLRAERIGALEVGRLISSTLDMEQVLHMIMQRITQTLDAEAGSILLVDGDELIFRVALGEMAEAVSPIRLKLGQGIAGWVAQEGRPLLVPRASEDPRFYPNVDHISSFHTRSILCVPLKSRNRIIGVIEVINKRAADFVEDDLYWLTMVASSAAMAIENAQLYEQTQAQVIMLEKANLDLKDAQEKLLQSAKLASIGQLAAGVAHEINNPLSVILGFSETIPLMAPLDPAVAKPLETIQREALRCRRIVQNLLDFASQSRLSLAPVNLNEVIDHTIPLLQYQISMQDIEIIKEYATDLPLLMVDRDQLQQVFVNLILNAVQAMPAGGQLTLRTGLRQGQIAIDIADTGMGIPEENLGHIFDPFFTTKGVGKGTGLGLSVSYGIVERHGGAILVDSQLGLGTTFTILLPIEPTTKDKA